MRVFSRVFLQVSLKIPVGVNTYTMLYTPREVAGGGERLDHDDVIFPANLSELCPAD